ncbi:hypothetical protein LF1_41580 [Rubripirellula obstinata]|uniref:Uncharacterized protein n=1 Tax=Rubripirellula obstinata TaxID=406547 RepID=A0A5B1CK75_9BACT|nr:hypothetical protein [Rubripirellula obstinata]KAA1261607.1 hypothetical protein LF1_41580 [Rubripirellula obstinata]
MAKQQNTPERVVPKSIDPNDLLGIADLAARGISHHTQLLARRDGSLKSVLVGSKTLHRGVWVLDWINMMATAQEAKRSPKQSKSKDGNKPR